MAASGKASLVSRSVASCFLFKFSPSAKPQVALFRRSAKVRTYQHRLAPISGSIEESDKSPIAAVWREINEETTLTPANLHLLRQGKPYSFTDEGVGRVWTVHPFAFSLRTEQDEGRITLDWEHDGFQWHDPLEVTDEESFGGVPFLAKSLRRVWFDMDLGHERGRILQQGLQMLKDDHESGARQLAGKALDVFRRLVTDTEGEPAEVWWDNARFSAWHLWKNGRESMGAAVLNVLLRALALVEKEVERLDGGVVTREFLQNIASQLRDLAEERKESVGRVWQSFQPVLERAQRGGSESVKILTLSSSSTTLECLKKAAGQDGLNLDVRILESRPLFEGASMASKLAQALGTKEAAASVKITVFSDASAAIASKEVDIVLLGADLIAADGAVSNKTGSLPAVLSAKHISPKAQVVVLAEKEKILPFPAPEHDEENKAAELTDAWSPGQRLDSAAETVKEAEQDIVQVKNIYFEWVPPSLVDAFVTEDGQTDVAGITAQAEDKKQEADRLFAEK